MISAVASLDWGMLDHAIGAVSVVAVFLLIMLRSDLKKYFATKEDISAIDLRLTTQDKQLSEHRDRVEQQLDTFESESRADSRLLETRMLQTEIALADLRATVSGVRDELRAVRHGVDMLVTHQLGKDRL